MRRTLTVAALLTVAASAVKHRGVMDSLASRYSERDGAGPMTTFTCLDGSSTIPESHVNDDYCDCADGTDEPGTAACSYTLRKPTASFQFQCDNAGFSTQDFPHSRVNDGICDCCDGSDEFASSAKCENQCAARREREEAVAAEREEKRRVGLAGKAAMVLSAQAEQQGLRENLAAQRLIVVDSDLEIAVAAAERDAAEVLEKAERVAIHTKSLAEKAVWDVEQAAKKEKEEKEKEEKEKEKSNEEVDVPPTEHVATDEDGAEGPPEPQGDDVPLPEEEEPAPKQCVMWRQTGGCSGDGPREETADKTCEDRIEGTGSGFCECEKTGAAEPETVKYRFDCGHEAFTCREICERNGNSAPTPTKGDSPAVESFAVNDGAAHKTDAANAAREKLRVVEQKKQDAEQVIKDTEEVLKEDFGPESIFLALKDKCFRTDEGHYTYEMCLFKEVRQIPRGESHGGTMLGRWKGWGERSYGSWGGSNDFAQLKFHDGAKCWGGPERTVTVRGVCGTENKLIKVDEPSMCTYTMVFETPALCE